MYITIENLKKEYNSREKFLALRGINISMKKGEFIGIMGPSGAGKTTLLNILATIDSPTYGDIRIDDLVINDLSKNEKAKYRGEYLGFVFQNYNLINNMTVKENILLPLMLDGKINMDEFNIVTKNLGIDKLISKYPYELSGGEKQRVSAARAIIKKPKLLLADEPTGNLDTKSASDFLKVIKNFNETINLTTIMVTHDPYVASYTDRVFILKDGKVFSELNKDSGRKSFHNKLINSLNLLGGE